MGKATRRLHLTGLILFVTISTVLSGLACSSKDQRTTMTDDQAHVVVVERLISLSQTPESKEYVGMLFPSLAEGDFVERHDDAGAWKYVIDRWPQEARGAFARKSWFLSDFDEHFSSFYRPTWVIYDDGKIVPVGGALLVEADIEKLNRDRALGSDRLPNVYVVSSELQSVPIFDSETDATVGQAYNGFAVPIGQVRDGKAHFSINTADPSDPNNLKRREFYIPTVHMKMAYIEPQNVPAIISLDTIILNPMAGIASFSQRRQQVIARFNQRIGPIHFIQNVQNGFMFTLGANVVHVSESDCHLVPATGAYAPWIEQLIQRMTNEPVANPPASITRYDYKGQTVYYVPPQFADIWSTLYDSEGNIIGHPDGGISGNGDGHVRDFLTERTNRQAIWSDTRTYDPGMRKETAPINSVEILTAELDPRQYTARVVSGLPNSCAIYGGYYFARNGDAVQIDTVNWIPIDPTIACAEIYRTVEHDIRLGSDFVPGTTYTVKVNDKVVTFTAQ